MIIQKMLTYFDLIQDKNFREFVTKRLSIRGKYFKHGMPICFPKLYRYRSFTNHAVDDIIAQAVTFTSIGSFNDLFDGAIHRKKEFRLLEYIGTYAACFSTKVDSVLMWSHYAASSSGICIEYDFNRWMENDIHRKFLFPVKYSQNPINISDLLDYERQDRCKYPLDAATLCAALNKSAIWRYENEWRMIYMNLLEEGPYASMTISLDPAGIYLGYHFLKPFFYYNESDIEEKEKCTRLLEELNRLLSYTEENSIALFFMKPSIGMYSLKTCMLDVNQVRTFIKKHFTNCKGIQPKDMKSYWTVHDNFADIIAKTAI